MRSAAFKDTLREIARTKNRFLSIFLIVALGAGFFSGLKMTCPDMLATADGYYASSDLMDIKLVSTYGFSENDIAAVRGAEGIAGILPAYSKDVFVINDKNANILAKVMSLPDGGTADWADRGMNSAVLLEGRMPQAPDECLAERNSGLSLNFKLGQQISVMSADEQDDPLEDSLARDSWTVVGIVRSPLYISFERGATDIGNGSLDCFIMVPEENFTYEVYTEVFVTLEKEPSLSAFSDEYEDMAEAGVERFEDIAELRETQRFQEIKDEANAELDDAKAELADGKKEASEELGSAKRELDDAEKELADAKAELFDGWAEYYDGVKEFEDGKEEYHREIADAEADLKEAREEMDDSWDEYYGGVRDYEDGLEEYRKGKQELWDAEQAIKNELAKAGYSSTAEMEAVLEGGQAEIDSARQLIGSAQSMMQHAGTPVPGADQVAGGLSQLDSQLGQLFLAYMNSGEPEMGGMLSEALGAASSELDGRQGDIDAGREGLRQFEQALQEIGEGRRELDKAYEKLEKAKYDLEAAFDMLNEGERQYAEGLEDFEEGKADGEKELADAEKELADALTELTDGEKEYADGLEEYEDGLAEYDDAARNAAEEIADGEREIADAEEELANLKRPVWYVLDRNDNPGYSTYNGDAHRIEAVAKVFPVFFFLVAALVCLTTMTRMVEEQRTEIGTFKALGYGAGRIASKYLIYASIASVTGAGAGITLGCYLFPTVIFGAYGMMYLMPDIVLSLDVLMSAVVTAVCLCCTTLSALAACMAELRSSPAELMRPRAPKPGKRVFLERVGFIWKRLNFTRKVTVRNLFRYKKRILMTVVGIAGCTALTLTGFGLDASISSIMDKQYDEISRYDLIIALDDKADAEDMDEVYALLDTEPLAGESMPVYQKAADVGRVSDVSLFVLTEPENVDRYIDLRERLSQRHITLESDGAVITEKLSEHLSLSVGDEITFSVNKKEASVPITAISENYALHFIYMTPECYRQYFGELPPSNIVLSAMPEDSQESRDELASKLIDLPAVLALTFAQDSRDEFGKVMQNLNYVVALVIASAALLAFVVLYNLTNINITERVREIATIKVLGFYDKEVSAYVYRENVLLTLMGDCVGLVLGIWLHRFVISVAETDAAMFGRTLPPWCFIAAFVMTFIFSMFVNWIMYFRLKKISMVESLKSVE